MWTGLLQEKFGCTAANMRHKSVFANGNLGLNEMNCISMTALAAVHQVISHALPGDSQMPLFKLDLLISVDKLLLHVGCHICP